MRVEIRDATRPPPPLAARRERREGGTAKREKGERRRGEEGERGERRCGRERKSRRVGLPIFRDSPQGFASNLSDGSLRGRGFVFIGEARKP